MKKALIMGTMLGTFALPGSAMAIDEAAMMKQLQMMQEQMNQMQKQIGALKSELAQAKSQASAAQKTASEVKAAKATEKKGSDVKITMSPAPKFETADGEYSFKVGGFAQVDAGVFDDDRADYPDGTNIRRARLNVSGTIAKYFNYKIENDFAASTTGNTGTLTDVYLEYTGFKPTTIMVGQFKEPFGLETLTSDLFTSFVERASPFVFSPDRKIGAAISTSGTESPIGAWSVTVGGFGDGSGIASTNDEAHDLTGRLTWAPIAEKTRVAHLGIAGSYRIPDSANDSMTFASRPETNLSNARNAVTTGLIPFIDNVSQLGLEAAGVWGPASIQGEYVVADVNRRAGFADPTFGGYYVEASYFLTGESRNYVASSGKFDRVKPQWPFSISEGNWGAWQIMARYSNLDLNDPGAGINGGQMQNTTFGIKWYPTANTAILADYIMVNTDAFGVTANDDPRIWVLRTQFDF